MLKGKVSCTPVNPAIGYKTEASKYSQHDLPGGNRCRIKWDLRQPPCSSAQLIESDQTLSDTELAQHATHPPLNTLQIICGVLPFEWPIIAQNPTGVTIADVLQAIHQTVMVQIKQNEYDALSLKQRNRIAQIFDTRWRASLEPRTIWSFGVLRVDCLLNHTIFAGLTMTIEGTDACIVSLRRVN
ncbi:hypothetical protein PTI98_008665 [Pleurotus ostreatus]|nr:hypothetical protein PTI98_008665 [Pleurotus ostreatus]